MPSLRNDLEAALGQQYTFERELGGGGMSRVFLATDAALGRKVVVKVLAPELGAGVSVERFQREIRLAAQLQHPAIVPVLTAGEAAGLPYYTMPFVDGQSLAARITRTGALPVDEAVSILKDVTRALVAAHEQGVVHRDIKPENILLTGDAAVVTDFGIAKAVSASRTLAPGGTLTQVGTSLGTPMYMAPEQAAGDPATDQRADLYALGGVAYEMLTGTAPFADREPHRLFAAHMNEKPVPIASRRPDCARPLAMLIMRCLEKEPADRPQTARELLTDLNRISTGVITAAGRGPGRGKVTIALVAAVVVIVGALTAMWARYGRTADADLHSVAVLPFENIGGDTANAYFADGMAEELRTALTKLPGLTVASRSAAEDIGKRRPLAAQLHFGTLLEGTVRRDHDRLRLTAQLTRTDNGAVIWADSYQQNANDVFAVQDSVTRAIVGALRLQLTGTAASPGTAVVAQGTRDPQAYDLYLRGRYLLYRRSDLPQAITLFQQSIARDSSFARAYAGLAMTYSMLPLYSKTAPLDIIGSGIAAGRRATELDGTLSDAELGLANMLQLDYKWAEAEAHYKRALALDPSSAAAHQWYGDLLYTVGRLPEADRELRRAVALDPLSAVFAVDLAYELNIASKFQEAAELAKRGMALDASYGFGLANYAIAIAGLGKPDSAIAILRAGATDSTDVDVQLEMIQLLHAGHHDAQALARLATFRRNVAPASTRAAGEYARAFASLGMRDSAAVWLERSVTEHDASLFLFSAPCDLVFDPVRQDPRFTAQLRRMGLGTCRR
jgi:serine/threonine-protein kinase